MNESLESFPVDHPLEVLKREHELVRKLAQAYFDSKNAQVKLRSAEQILRLLETHSQMEECVFYPAVRAADPRMVAHLEKDHHKIDELLAALRLHGLKDAESFLMFEQAVIHTMQHIREEEEEFFPLLEKEFRDMSEIGLQMQAYENKLLYTPVSATRSHARI